MHKADPLTEMEIEALQLCASFQRCMNYPKDELGVIALARGLVRAQRLTQVLMERIVSECLETSMYCPTDADFMTVARDIRGPNKAEDIPAPSRDEVRKQWRAFADSFPQIAENGRKWHEQHRIVCAKIRNAMGADRWIESSTKEKVAVGIELGMTVCVKPPEYHTIEDMGLGIFVPRYPL